MVAISKLALGLSAVAASLAAPTVEPAEPAVEARGMPNFVLDDSHPLMMMRRNFTDALKARSNTNYVQKYTTGGTVNFNSGTNQFSLTFNTQQDFVVGVGWNPGSTAPITHSGSFSVTSGLGSLSVYGWSTNPLVEYYVMECNHGVSTGGTQKGSLTSDGSTYAIWEHQQTNQPSIQGTSTFQQYISISSDCRTSGTVTVNNHFQAWAKQGMNLGTLNFQVIAVESWNGAGSATQSVTNTGSGSTTTTGSSPPPPPPPPASTGSGGSTGSGSCSALWGQCGGQGWSGPTCCSQGTCHSNGQYYSQCTQ